MSNMNTSPRIIRRNCIKVELRGETFEIYGLSIANLEKLKQSISSLLVKVFQKIGELQQQDWNSQILPKQGFFNKLLRRKTKLAIPTQTMDFLDGLINSVFKEPLELLESASGLPHEFFDPSQKERCLSIEEIKQLAEIVFEVNGLGFAWTALKQLGRQMVESIQKKPSVPSVSGMVTPSAN
ncbi:MAG TPA: hypothetical protein VHY08_21430 [Bacillota bacterium]|nr:hypothetical protein [Bacillota bacterium]